MFPPFAGPVKGNNLKGFEVLKFNISKILPKMKGSRTKEISKIIIFQMVVMQLYFSFGH